MKAGFLWATEIDIKNCYQSFDGNRIANLIPIPKKVVEQARPAAERRYCPGVPGLVRLRPGRDPEFDVFASGRPKIGQNHPSAKLYAQTLARDLWAHDGAGVNLSAIRNIVAVHRLRGVSCPYGFTRFEAAPTSADGDLEDIQLAVRGARQDKLLTGYGHCARASAESRRPIPERHMRCCTACPMR